MFFSNWKFNKLLLISNNFPKQGTAAWLNIRKFFMSGTKVTKLKKRRYFFETLSSKIFTGNKYTEHGKYYENIARQKYELETKGNVLELNFIVHGTHKQIGFSPDGYDVHNDCLIEIKCPYSADLNKKVKEEHYDQMQLGLLVLMTQGIDTYCNYVVYEAGKDKLTIKRINRDPDWYPELEEHVDQYFKEKKTHDLIFNKLFI